MRLSCLARNGRSPGEESLKRERCGSDDRGAAGLRPDQAIKEARCVARAERNLRRRRGKSRSCPTRGRSISAYRKKRCAGNGDLVSQGKAESECLLPWVYADRADIGIDWKDSRKAHHLPLKLDDPSFIAPI